MFKFKPLGYFQTSVVLVEPRSLVRLSCLHLVYGPHEGAIERTRPWESLVAQIATGPWCLLKVRLCSPLQLVTLLYRCVFRLPPTPSSSTSQNPSCTNLFGEFFCTYLYEFISDYVYVQNLLPRNIQASSMFSWIIAWRRRLGFGDDDPRRGDRA